MKEDWTDDWDKIRQYREDIQKEISGYCNYTDTLGGIIWSINERLEHLENIVERLVKKIENG